MATQQIQPVQPAEEPTIGRLVHDASKDISSLVQQEIRLAKSELKVSVTAGAVGIGLFAAAGFVAVLAIIMLSVAIAYFIHLTGLGLHWSFLIVFGFYLLVTAILGLVGLKKVKQVKAPEKAIEQGREIPKALRGQA